MGGSALARLLLLIFGFAVFLVIWSLATVQFELPRVPQLFLYGFALMAVLVMLMPVRTVPLLVALAVLLILLYVLPFCLWIALGVADAAGLEVGYQRQLAEALHPVALLIAGLASGYLMRRLEGWIDRQARPPSGG